MELFSNAEEEGHVYKNIAVLNQMVRFPSLERRVLICEEIFILHTPTPQDLRSLGCILDVL